jgi:hypothetical protein
MTNDEIQNNHEAQMNSLKNILGVIGVVIVFLGMTCSLPTMKGDSSLFHRAANTGMFFPLGCKIMIAGAAIIVVAVLLPSNWINRK